MIEYAGQASDPIELRIYPGRDGDFSLYEDECDSYRYEQGAHSIIPIHWDDVGRGLTIEGRQGSYKGKPAGHTFNVVIVSSGHGVGGEPVSAPDKVIRYAGTRIIERF